MKIIPASAACALVAALSLSAAAKEVRVKMKDLPPAVAAAVKSQAGKAGKIRSLSRETEDGKTVYEAELTIAGAKKDVSFDESGKVVETEERVALSKVPPAARKSIELAAAKGKVLKVEAVGDGTKIVAYEAKVRVGKKKTEVRVDPTGKPAPEQ